MNTSDLLTSSIAKARCLYAQHGFVIVDNPLLTIEEEDHILENCQRFSDWIVRDSMGSMGERANYLLADYEATRRHLVPWADDLYQRAQGIVSDVIDELAICSPYKRSSVNTRLYLTGGAEGLHLDTNPISCLLFVSHGAPLQIQLLTGEWVKVRPIAGRVAVFQGRRMPHRVPIWGEQFRVSMPLNFYTLDDLDRPEWIDGMYENRDAIAQS